MNYMRVITLGFSTVQCHVLGDPSVYEDLIWDSGDPLPSKATLDAYVEAHPDLFGENIDVNVLENGMPAFFDSARGVVRSISEYRIIFAASTTGAKNFYLNNEGLVSSNLKGHLIDINSIVIRVVGSIQNEVQHDVVFHLINNVTEEEILTETILPGNKHIVDTTVNLSLEHTVELSCRLTSDSKVVNPTFFIYLSHIN